jgi:hypothetical protein
MIVLLGLERLMSQFHYGSIKTICMEKWQTTDMGLNSTMVRLKLWRNTLHSKKNRLSQFNYGSIKTEIYEVCEGNHLSLNSTMVRLKHRLGFGPEYSD